MQNLRYKKMFQVGVFMNYSVYDRSKLIDKETIYDHYCVLDDFYDFI